MQVTINNEIFFCMFPEDHGHGSCLSEMFCVGKLEAAVDGECEKFVGGASNAQNKKYDDKVGNFMDGTRKWYDDDEV